MSVRMLAPVVVKPDMDSKYASVKSGMARKKDMKARRQAATIQPSATMAMPSRWLK
jgi:hypothetical protein